MEAAVRSARKFATGKDLLSLDFPALRGAADGIKHATIDFGGTKVSVAVAQGIANAKKLIERIRTKDDDIADMEFVEAMICAGGCVGGSPKAKAKKAVDARVGACYEIDVHSTCRTSHANPEILQFYERFGGKPGSRIAHEYLHTHHRSRPREK
jgi:iron only hydrogenase large subunit-like protein